ncbi:uncharacterized protein LOC127748359 [Arachis duranensis]|uniref:Uncharacterized protein LOC127748359 n=1 Tax=Arachis duranensis TaxID=130453 RepID=A0A9C6TWZ8_ARADU|nr:uncharacterized protein LOC127748359 [Arachis duranensis]XP_052118646.1 uncharacterized protein LOC127748359 [Arachis duranensis]
MQHPRLLSSKPPGVILDCYSFTSASLCRSLFCSASPLSAYLCKILKRQRRRTLEEEAARLRLVSLRANRGWRLGERQQDEERSPSATDGGNGSLLATAVVEARDAGSSYLLISDISNLKEGAGERGHKAAIFLPN